MSLNPLDSLFDLGKTAIDKIWPDANKRAEELRKLEELRQSGDLARLNAQVQMMVGQLDINKVEAAHKSIFVAGWRPFIGWVCGVALAWSFIGLPVGEFILAILEKNIVLPEIKTESLFELVLGMLGLGGLRTYEKMKGVSREK